MVRVPVVTQDADTDSGPACLTALALAFGQPASLEQLRQHFDPDPDPGSALALCAAAQAWGIMLHPALPTPNDLADQVQDLPLPAILELRGHRYVVADRVHSSGEVRVMDPAVGRRWISQDELRAQASGLVMTAGKHHTLLEPPLPGPGRRRLRDRVMSMVRRDMPGMALLASLFVAGWLGLPVLTVGDGEYRVADGVPCHKTYDGGQMAGAEWIGKDGTVPNVGYSHSMCHGPGGQ